MALDDFGNGYSSLSYLKDLPLNVLKIDKSFIKDIAANNNSDAITTAIIAMGHTMNLQVVAEGVETNNQLDFLKARHCDKIKNCQSDTGSFGWKNTLKDRSNHRSQADNERSPIIQLAFDLNFAA